MTTSHDTTTGSTATATEGRALRCSNADREQICAVLHQAAGDGHLTMEETEERLGQAYAARYGHELDELVADLPRAAESPSGWTQVMAMARHQIGQDVAVLVGRTPGTRAHRLQVLVAAISILSFVIGITSLLLHGVFADGPEFSRHELH